MSVSATPLHVPFCRTEIASKLRMQSYSHKVIKSSAVERKTENCPLQIREVVLTQIFCG